MSKLTVNEIIQKVLQEAGSPLSAKEILAAISEKKYYEFKSDNPVNIVMNELRRHTSGSVQAKNRKIFYEKLDNGAYKLIAA